MNYHKEKARAWLANLNLFFPALPELIRRQQTPVLIIGACVFDLYAEQGWIPPLTRKTGDLDFSIGLSHSAQVYKNITAELVRLNYQPDPLHPYRYHAPKKIPGAMTYVDVLAHPQGSMTAKEVRDLLGVGSEFNFAGFAFAEIETYKIEDSVAFPNPFAFANLSHKVPGPQW